MERRVANIHTPERLQGESFGAYCERRINAKKAVEKITLTGKFQPGKETSREAFRDTLRRNGTMHKHAGAYGRGLRNWINNQNRAALAQRLAKKQASV